MCVLSVLMAPAMVIRYNMGWVRDAAHRRAASSSRRPRRVANFYMVCQRELHDDWITRPERTCRS